MTPSIITTQDMERALATIGRDVALAQPLERRGVLFASAQQLVGQIGKSYLSDRVYEIGQNHDLLDEKFDVDLAALFQQPEPIANGHDLPPPAGPADYGAPDVPPPPPATLHFIDASTLAGHQPPPRRWLVANRIPLGNVTLLSGDGAAGKTTIALQLACGTVAIGSWLNAVIDQQGAAMVLSAEEDQDEIHRRLLDVVTHHKIQLDALAGLHLLGMPGEDALLGAADRNGVIRPTPLFLALEQRAREIQPVLIVIEAAADVFGGNENDRAQVRQFIGLLRRLCSAADGAAVVLIAHPSLTGMASGTGTSGSTGWSNSVRSRLYFAKASKREGSEDTDGADDIRELRVMKSNYGPAGEVIRTRWARGVFVPEGSPSTLERAAAEADADHAYLACLDAATVQGRTVFPHPGKGYAPKVFVDMPQAQRMPWRALALAQERLFASGRIHVVEYGSPSKRRSRIERRAPLSEAAE